MVSAQSQILVWIKDIVNHFWFCQKAENWEEFRVSMIILKQIWITHLWKLKAHLFNFQFNLQLAIPYSILLWNSKQFHFQSCNKILIQNLNDTLTYTHKLTRSFTQSYCCSVQFKGILYKCLSPHFPSVLICPRVHIFIIIIKTLFRTHTWSMVQPDKNRHTNKQHNIKNIHPFPYKLMHQCFHRLERNPSFVQGWSENKWCYLQCLLVHSYMCTYHCMTPEVYAYYISCNVSTDGWCTWEYNMLWKVQFWQILSTIGILACAYCIHHCL